MGGKSLSGFFDPYGTGKLRKKPRYEITVEELANDIKIGDDTPLKRIQEEANKLEQENKKFRKPIEGPQTEEESFKTHDPWLEGTKAPTSAQRREAKKYQEYLDKKERGSYVGKSSPELNARRSRANEAIGGLFPKDVWNFFSPDELDISEREYEEPETRDARLSFEVSRDQLINTLDPRTPDIPLEEYARRAINRLDDSVFKQAVEKGRLDEKQIKHIKEQMLNNFKQKLGGKDLPPKFINMVDRQLRDFATSQHLETYNQYDNLLKGVKKMSNTLFKGLILKDAYDISSAAWDTLRDWLVFNKLRDEELRELFKEKK